MKKYNSPSIIDMEVEPGTSIGGAIEKAIRLSQGTGYIVEFKFNQHKFEVNPSSSYEDIILQWNVATGKNDPESPYHVKSTTAELLQKKITNINKQMQELVDFCNDNKINLYVVPMEERTGELNRSFSIQAMIKQIFTGETNEKS